MEITVPASTMRGILHPLAPYRVAETQEETVRVQCCGLVSLEVPEGRYHIVAHRFSGGVCGAMFSSPEGAAQGRACAAPSGLSFLQLHVPTAKAVGYVLSSLTGLDKWIFSLELAEEGSGGKLAGLDPQEVNLSGAYDVRGITWNSGSERKGCAPGRGGSGVGACDGLSGDERSCGVDVNASERHRARAIGADLARADL